MNFKCLNVKIDNLSQEEVLNRIKNVLNQKSQDKTLLQINTVNPEFILEAQKNQKFRDILNAKTSLNIADGIGLKFAGWRYGQHLKYRFPGVDLLQEILKIANANREGILIITHKNSLSDKNEIQTVIKKLYPRLLVKTIIAQKSSPHQYENLISANTNYDIALCNFGAPEQEIFLNDLQHSGLKLAMGVGGSFDFLTGKIKRAPKWMRKIGLEWLWRLILEPRYRLKRIWRAVIIFPIRVIANR